MRFESANLIQVGVPPENVKMRSVLWSKSLGNAALDPAVTTQA